MKIAKVPAGYQCSVQELTGQSFVGFSAARQGAAWLYALEGLPASRQLAANRLDCRSPHERLRLLVPGFEELVDRPLEVGHHQSDRAGDERIS